MSGSEESNLFAGVAQVPEVSSVSQIDLSVEELEVRESVGHGGSATVYEATTQDGQQVAVKEPHVVTGEQVREQFQNEAETWSHLDHPHIVHVYDWGLDPQPRLVLEYADAGTLADYLAAMDLDEALWTSVNVANAVRYAHQRGVMHFDLKPENILLFSTTKNQWRVPKVTDWGLSELLLTHSGKPKGLTFQYAAPEQFERGTATDAATDIYQLGATVYALLTGEPPASGTQNEIMDQVTSGDIPRASTVNAALPSAIDRVLARALATDPTDRYDDVLLFARELRSLFDDVYSDTSVTHTGVDTGRTSTTEVLGPITTPTPTWEISLDESPIAPPLVADGNAYLATHDGTVSIIDIASGTITASEAIGANLRVAPVLAGDSLHLVTEANNLVMLTTDLLDHRGSQSLPGRSTDGILVAEGRIYTVTSDSTLVCVEEGGVAWQTALPGRPGGPPAAMAGTVVVPTFDGTVAVDGEQGRQQWSWLTTTPHRTAPAVTSDTVISGGTGSLTALAADSGTEKWQVAVEGRITTIATDMEVVFGGTDRGYVLAVDRDDGTVRWRTRLKGRVPTGFCFGDEALFIGCAGLDNRPLHPRMDGILSLDPQTGSEHWGYAPGDAVIGHPVVLDESLLVATTTGIVQALE